MNFCIEKDTWWLSPALANKRILEEGSHGHRVALAVADGFDMAVTCERVSLWLATEGHRDACRYVCDAAALSLILWFKDLDLAIECKMRFG